MQQDPDDFTGPTLRTPKPLYHATNTADAIMASQLDGPAHFSDEADIDLVAWYWVLNSDELTGITVFELDPTGLDLHWPGYDGVHHYVSQHAVPASRLSVHRVYTPAEVHARLCELYSDVPHAALWLSRHAPSV